MTSALSSIGDWLENSNFSKGVDKFLEGSPKYTVPAIATLLGANYLSGGIIGPSASGGSSMSTIPVGYRASLAGGGGAPADASYISGNSGFAGLSGLSSGSAGGGGGGPSTLPGVGYQSSGIVGGGSDAPPSKSWLDSLNDFGNGLNQFGSHFNDFADGLAQYQTKDNSYRTNLAERSAARRRQRLSDTLAPLQDITNMIAKDPRVAQLYGPGGPYEDTLTTQISLARDAAAQAGLNPDIISQYSSVIGAAMSVPPEDAKSTAAQQNLHAWELAYNGGRPAPPEVARQFLGGGAPGDAAQPKLVHVHQEAGSQEIIGTWQNPDGSLEQRVLGHGNAPQSGVSLSFGVDSNGNFVTTGGGGGGMSVGGGTAGVPAATGGTPGAGTTPGGAVMPVGKPEYGTIQGTNERINDLNNGVQQVDALLGIAGRPGSQFGAVGGVKAAAREITRVGGDVAGLAPGVREQLNGLVQIANRTFQADMDNPDQAPSPEVAAWMLTKGDPAVDADAMEARLTYLAARMLQPDGKILMDAVKSAQKTTKLFGLQSEQTVVQHLLMLREAMVQNRQALQKSSGFNVQASPPIPDLGEYNPLVGKPKQETKEPPTGGKRPPAAETIPPPQQREVNKIYHTPKGDYRWTKEGWVKP